MKKILTSVFVFIAQLFFVLAQNREFTINNFTGKEDGLKEAQSNIKKGDEFYRAGTYMYFKALDFYLKANYFNPENALLNYKIGACYLYSPFKQKAVAHLEKAKMLDPKNLI